MTRIPIIILFLAILHVSHTLSTQKYEIGKLSGSMIHIKHPKSESAVVSRDILEQFVETYDFDNKLEVRARDYRSKPGDRNDMSLSLLFPADSLQNMPKMKRVVDDMEELIVAMARTNCEENDHLTLTARLTIRCPKFHEDNVDWRLLKTYYGIGTQFVDPADNITRLSNWIRRGLDMDLNIPPHKIKQADEGDILVIAGGKRFQADKGAIPVLHRSPNPKPNTNPSRLQDSSGATSRRLLFSITIN